MSGIHGTSRWRKLSEQLRRERLPVCHICGKPIDLDLPSTHRLSWTLDHIRPVASGVDPFDTMNLSPSHRACNSAKSARGDMPNTTPPRCSRNWG